LSTRNSHQIIAKGDFLKRSRFIVLVLVWWLCNKRTKWFHCSRRQTGHDFNRLFARAEGNGLMEQKFTSNPINIKSKEIKTKIDWNYLLQTSHKSWRNLRSIVISNSIVLFHKFLSHFWLKEKEMRWIGNRLFFIAQFTPIVFQHKKYF
jgi:hypothetical protein